MEAQATATQNSQAVGGSGEQSKPAQLSPVSPAFSASNTEAQRAKWRAKYYKAKERKATRLGGQTLAGSFSPLPTNAGASDSPLAASGGPPAVPWTSDTLKPLFAELIPAIERADVESIAKKAAKISPELVAVVKTDAAWSAPAKASLETTAPQVAAKWLNAAGISADNAGEVILGVAILSIVTSRQLLLGKLKEMETKRQAPQPSPLGNAPA